jgi:hypothetical protein
MSDTFNADDFMNETIEGAMDTEFKVIPPGEYLAQLADEQPDLIRHGTSEKTGQVWKGVRLVWNVLDDKVKADLDRETVSVRQEFFLDLDEDSKLALGAGKNVRLGKLRDALGLNQGPFNFNMLKGAGPARIKVGHEKAKNGETYAKVTSVTRA